MSRTILDVARGVPEPDHQPDAPTTCPCTDCVAKRLLADASLYTAHDMADAWRRGFEKGRASADKYPR